MHCYHCQGGVKELSGEQESRKVSLRISEGQICVQERGLEAGERFTYWIAVWRVDFFSHLYC